MIRVWPLLSIVFIKCVVFSTILEKISRLLKFSNFVPLPLYTMLVFRWHVLQIHFTSWTNIVWRGEGGGFKVNSCFNWKMFDHMFSNLSVYFEKSTHIFSKIVWKNTMDNPFTKLIVPSFSKHNFQIRMDSILGT
jgi:hypothetical protein